MSTNQRFWDIIEPEFPEHVVQTSRPRDSVHEAAGAWMVIFGAAFFFGVLAYAIGIPA